MCIVGFLLTIQPVLASANGTSSPEDTLSVYAPMIIQAAPSNESTIVTLHDGSSRVFYINRPGEADKLMSIRSSDGKVWESPETEINLPGTAYYANRVMEDDNKTLHAVFHLWGEGNNGYRNRHLDLWYCKKKNNESWGKPVKILDGYVGSIRSFMQLKSGRLLMSFGRAIQSGLEKPVGNTKDYGWNEVISLYSDDQGLTWQSSRNALKIEIDKNKITRYGAVEPDVVELTNGDLWMLIRTNKGMFYESFSRDAGTTWEIPRPTLFISSDSPASFLRLRDGRLVLFLNMNQRWDTPDGYAFGGREALHAAISRDEGRSWEGFREVFKVNPSKEKGDRGTAYTSATETPNGKVLLVTGQGDARAILMFDPDWLTQPSKETVTFTQEMTSLNNDLVFNFSAAKKGSVNLKLLSGCSSARIALTDHFSISSDSLAIDNAVANFSATDIPTNSPLIIEWDSDQKKASLSVKNQDSLVSEFLRFPAFGINYLRIRIDSPCREKVRFELETDKTNQ